MSIPLYRDPEQTIDARVEDLLARMTLAEKVGQLMQLSGGRDLDELIDRYGVGSILHILGERSAVAIERAGQTRLGIPLLLAEDGIHGHSFWPGATIFPTQLAMACCWNPELLERVGRVSATEISCTGTKWTFSPVLCLTRDLRWGRVGETFGEDPFLVGEFACALIRGYQGKGLDDPTAVLATAKHYAGYSETQGGRDASEADLSRRKLRSYFLPPFERAAREGCMAFMTGYQSIEGLPSTANHWLLTEILKEEWGFEGILVTDWDNVGAMHNSQKICATMKEAAALAIRSGNDLMMQTPAFFEGAQEAVADGMIAESEVDAVVRRILALKFRLGLFENPCAPDPERQQIVIGCDAHAAVNLQVARESIVLLKNDGLLPLARPKRIAVVGPNADDANTQLGDWTLGTGQMDLLGKEHPRTCTTTVLDGVRMMAGVDSVVSYARGCDGNDDDEAGIQEAVGICADADVAVVVVGDSNRLIGEFCCTATLELQGAQKPLLAAVAETGTPMVVVLINSKPLVLPEAAQSSAAIIEAFNPGMKGGQAIAEAIFGEINPSGKLTISFPYHVGQQPVFYSQVRGQHGNRYADMTQDPMFAFGQGMSYTRYAYTALNVLTPDVGMEDIARFEVTLTNTGERAGVEIAQLYISDLVTSATWVNKELKAYRRVPLEAGESKRIQFELPVSALSLVNVDAERVVEPGEFEVKIGPSSRDQDLLKGRFVVRHASESPALTK